jgi:hypothetical protein
MYVPTLTIHPPSHTFYCTHSAIYTSITFLFIYLFIIILLVFAISLVALVGLVTLGLALPIKPQATNFWCVLGINKDT